jgi:hypothetical protein
MYRDDILELAPMFLVDTDDEQLVSMIVNRGIKLEIAERVVALLPIAFGRAVLERIGPIKFSDTFIVKETGKQYLLRDEPIFNEGRRLAKAGLLETGVFSAIAMRSPELRAANKALNEGAELHDENFSAPVIWGFRSFL